MAESVIIDLTYLNDLCGLSRLTEIKRKLKELKVGQEAILITNDPEIWYSLTNLNEELGYEIVETSKDQKGRYSVRIKTKA